MLEKFAVGVLGSPPNRRALRKIMEEKLGISEFVPVCLEFPIFMEKEYGFIDMLGLGPGEETKSLIFIETKWGPPKMEKKAQKEIESYKFYFRRNGFYPDDLMWIYSDALSRGRDIDLKETRETRFCPLVLNRELVKSHIQSEFDELIERYAEHREKRLSKKLPPAKKEIDALRGEGLVPLTVRNRKADGSLQGEILCFNREGERVERKMEPQLPNAPTYYGHQLTNKEVLESISSGEAVIHFYLDGVFRPNFFFQLEEDRWICLQHVGKGILQNKGVYDYVTAMDTGEDSLLGSAVEVDSGIYGARRVKSKTSVSFYGRRFEGSLRLKISGENIGFSGRLSRSEEGRQELLGI